MSAALQADSARRPTVRHRPIVLSYGAILPVPPSDAFDLDNRRTFEPVSSAARLRGATEIPPRGGVMNLVDRAQILMLRRVYAEAMKRLSVAVSTHS